MSQNNIVQNTPEWLEAKLLKIGGSEIYSLVYHYCKTELKALGVDLMKEKPFKSALELFIKIKHGEEINDISEVNSEFGKGMESYINNRLSESLQQCLCEQTDAFIVDEEFHKLAACSPDGYIITNDNLIDFDKTCEIEPSQGVIELKTTPYDFNFEAEKGAKWSYIFQLQYQMAVCNTKWGVLAAISPKESQFDTDFFKGKVIGGPKDSSLDSFYNFYYYILPKIPSLQDLIIKALNAFQADLEALRADPNADKYPTISEGDKVKLEREKKLFGKLWPEKFGEWQADEEVSAMITERMIAHQEALKAETVKAELDNKIILATRRYTKIIGQDYKIVYDTRGSMRYSKV